jgi:hypothetical protein
MLYLALLGIATPRTEQRERTQQEAPEADEQADLNLFLCMPNNDEVNGNAAQGQCEQHAQGAKRPARMGTRCEGRHRQRV